MLIFSTILLRLSITLFAVPHLALGAELSDDYFERSRVMSYNNLFGYMGVIIMHIFVWFLIFPYFAGEKIGQLYQESYTPIAIFSMVLISLCILSSAYFTKDRIPYLNQPSRNESHIKITDLFKDIYICLYMYLQKNTLWRSLFQIFLYISIRVTDLLMFHSDYIIKFILHAPKKLF